MERLLYLRIADMMRYEIFAALTEYMRENVFRYSYFIYMKTMVIIPHQQENRA